MKYLITEILSGIAFIRQEQLTQLEQTIKKTEEEIQVLLEAAEDAPRRLNAMFIRMANQVKVLPTVHQDSADIRRMQESLSMFLRSLPLGYEVERRSKRLAQLHLDKVRLERESENRDTEVEQFLRIMVSRHGETYVTQTALKNAGFQLLPFTSYIMANARGTGKAPTP